MSSILNLLDIWSTNSSCHLNYSDIYMSGNTNKGRIWEGQSAVGGRAERTTAIQAGTGLPTPDPGPRPAPGEEGAAHKKERALPT